MNHTQKNIFGNKVKSFFGIFIVFVFSACVYTFSLSILSLAAIYTFFMIRALFSNYVNKKGYLDKKSLIKVAILSFLIICVGYYCAYVYFYYSYYIYEGIKPFQVIFGLIPLLYRLDFSLITGSFFFIIISYLGGFAINYQYIKHETKTKEQQELIAFKKEMGIEDNNYYKNNKWIGLMIGVGIIVICAGLFTEWRYNKADKRALLKRYDEQLTKLKETDLSAYNKAIEVLDGQVMNPNFMTDEYYVNGKDYTFQIYANFASNDYSLEYFYTNYCATPSFEWGEWYPYNGKNTLIDLTVHMNGQGYLIITITNSVNDDKAIIFMYNN